jgi:hypothetical protein
LLAIPEADHSRRTQSNANQVGRRLYIVFDAAVHVLCHPDGPHIGGGRRLK